MGGASFWRWASARWPPTRARRDRAPSSLPPQSTGTVEGLVTTQRVDPPGRLACHPARRFARGRDRRCGRRRPLPSCRHQPGVYQISASLEGFVHGRPGHRCRWTIGRVVARPAVAASPNSRGSGAVDGVAGSGTLNSGDEMKSKEMEELAPSGGFQSALRLLASVIEVPRRREHQRRTAESIERSDRTDDASSIPRPVSLAFPSPTMRSNRLR